MDEHHVHAPVAPVVLVLDVPVVGEHEVDAGLVLVAPELLVQVAQGLGGWQADQEVGVLLPLRQEPHPARLPHRPVVLGVQRDVGDDLADDGLDAGVLRVRLADESEEGQSELLDDDLTLLGDGGVREQSLEAIFH